MRLCLTPISNCEATGRGGCSAAKPARPLPHLPNRWPAPSSSGATVARPASARVRRSLARRRTTRNRGAPSAAQTPRLCSPHLDWERKEACTGSPFSRSAPRRSGCRWPASGAATAEAQDHRRVAKKGLPCPWVRPATSRPGRLFCRRLVVNGRVVGEAALPGRAHLPPRTPRPASPWVDRGHAPPLRPCDRPGPKAGGALRVRDARSAKPHSGAAEYCRCLCRMQHESRVSPRRREYRSHGQPEPAEALRRHFWIPAGMSAASRSWSSSPA